MNKLKDKKTVATPKPTQVRKKPAKKKAPSHVGVIPLAFSVEVSRSRPWDPYDCM